MMNALPKYEYESKLTHITTVLRLQCLDRLPTVFKESMKQPMDLLAPKTNQLAISYQKSAVAYAHYPVPCFIYPED